MHLLMPRTTWWKSTIFLNFATLVYLETFFQCLGGAQCNKKGWNRWGCTHSRGCEPGREGPEDNLRGLLQEKQCSSWACYCQGNLRGLQEVPSHSVGERRLNIFSLRAFVITSLGHQAILVWVWSLMANLLYRGFFRNNLRNRVSFKINCRGGLFLTWVSPLTLVGSLNRQWQWRDRGCRYL